MRSIAAFLLPLLATMVTFGCQSNGPQGTVPSQTEERCKGVHALLVQEIETTTNFDSGAKLAATLVAAAELDAEQIKVMQSGNASTDIKARLGTEMKGVVKSKSAVSQDFFEQDLNFARLACLLQNLRDTATTNDERAMANKLMTRFVESQLAYTEGLAALKKG
jgi:hypothetical protein